MNKIISKNTWKNVAIFLMIATFFIIDRYLKTHAPSLSASEPIKLVNNFFSFSFTANYYMAFSLPVSGLLLNLAIVLVICILIYYIIFLIRNRENQKSSIILLIIILLGAISNVTDRFIYGYVIDYLELRYFTVFNLADVMISFGALMLIFKNFNKNLLQKPTKT